jgi:HD-GYP domain-containing protein (c-di-GMP phosphodiesterase class II)
MRTTETVDHERIKTRQQAPWSTGDYPRSASVDVRSSQLGHRWGTWYDPELVDALRADAPELLVELDEPDLAGRTWELEPTSEVRLSDGADVDRIAGAFADIIDAKSPFTGSHSRGTAEVAQALARRLRLEPITIVDVRRAALLHDVGKLSVPNSILDKPGRLTDAEFTIVKRHPEMTHRILAPIPTFASVAELAASHHERLDGTGYFRGLGAEGLAIGARIVAVADVYEALTADRSYRSGMSTDEALTLIGTMAGDHLAAEVVAVLPDSGERYLSTPLFEYSDVVNQPATTPAMLAAAEAAAAAK